ncbi:MAG TPA: SDR family NAD(P)-dependent oxidoreductase, partial [Solirubrobacteraceae bacterium]
MSRPENPVALVTGGSRGIGKAIAERLQDDGFKVATLGRTSGDVQADVGDPDSVEAAFKEVRERFGPVLVLVNNAGERQDGLTIRMSAAQWESVIHTNLDGAFHCMRRALDDMLTA